MSQQRLEKNGKIAVNQGKIKGLPLLCLIRLHYCTNYNEPTGALDEKTGRHVLDYIIKLHKKQNFTMIMVTHNMNISETADRIIRMNSGTIVDITENANKKNAYEIGW